MSGDDEWFDGYKSACEDIFEALKKWTGARELRQWLAEEIGLSGEARQSLGLGEVRKNDQH